MKSRYVWAVALAVAAVCLCPGQLFANDPVAFAAPVFRPAASSASPTFAAPKFNCVNCTTCANGCQCFGGGYYCADGSCPVQFGQSQPVQYVQVCDGGTCRLVPVNAAGFAAGGCASGTCGTASSYGSYGGCASGSCGASTGRPRLFGGGRLFGRCR